MTTQVPREWTHEPGSPVYPRVPDLTPSRRPASEQCFERHPQGWACTRQPEHTGRHAAGGLGIIAAVWEAALTAGDEAAVDLDEQACQLATDVFDAHRRTSPSSVSSETVWRRVADLLATETARLLTMHHEGDGAPGACLQQAVLTAFACQCAGDHVAAEHELARPRPITAAEKSAIWERERLAEIAAGEPA